MDEITEQAEEAAILGEKIESEINQETSPLHWLPKQKDDSPSDDGNQYDPPVISHYSINFPRQTILITIRLIRALQELRSTPNVTPQTVLQQV